MMRIRFSEIAKNELNDAFGMSGRRIEHTGRFKRDYKREAKGPHRPTLESDFTAILMALAMRRWLLQNGVR